jgi:MoxR-like ATPase
VGANVDDRRSAQGDSGDPSGHPVTAKSDHEVTHGPDHEKEAEGVTDESRKADQGPADEDQDTVQQLTRREFARFETILGLRQNAKAHSPDDERAHSADDDQDHQRQQKADLLGYHDERGDLQRQTEQEAEEQHNGRVSEDAANQASCGTDRRVREVLSQYSGPRRSCSQVGLGGSTAMTTDPQAEQAALVEDALFQVKRVIVGQDRMIERTFVCLLARGHCLIEGVPGLAKTLMVSTLARVVGGEFSRIQFTPDLVPADIIGTRIWRPSREEFDIEWGPVFANIVLADEVNRAPAKVQSALLEVMSEGHVSIGGSVRSVEQPFLVLATQNPIESEGVYSLPEAQRDRFLMQLLVEHPSYVEEMEIARRMLSGRPDVDQVLTLEQLVGLQRSVDEVFVHHAVADYAVRLVMATRDPGRWGVPELASQIELGASPRATLGLLSAGRAMAVLRGRRYVIPSDVRDVSPEVLRHRILLSYDALAAGTGTEDVVRRVLEQVPEPRVAPQQDEPVHAGAALYPTPAPMPAPMSGPAPDRAAAPAKTKEPARWTMPWRGDKPVPGQPAPGGSAWPPGGWTQSGFPQGGSPEEGSAQGGWPGTSGAA